MRRIAPLSLLLSIIAVVSLWASPGARPDGLTASDILDRMAQVYASCTSYRDSGIVSTTFIGPERTWTEKKPFTTAFVRPDRFRFEYQEKVGGRFIAWRGGDVRTWWDLKPEIEHPKSLDYALAGGTGISGGSAHTVPALLLPAEVSGRKLTDLHDVKRLEDEALGSVECFRVRGTVFSTVMTIWIDKATFVVQRIDEAFPLGKKRVESTTTYEPILDQPVPDDALAFNPPQAK